MAKLTSIASRVISSMEKNGKVSSLSSQQTASIDNAFATGFRKIKNEFEVKEKNSRAYVAKLELSSFNR